MGAKVSLYKATWRPAPLVKWRWLFTRNIADGFIVGWTLYAAKATSTGWLYIHFGVWTLIVCLANRKVGD